MQRMNQAAKLPGQQIKTRVQTGVRQALLAAMLVVAAAHAAAAGQASTSASVPAASAAASAATTDALLANLKASADRAQAGCHESMHDDAMEYSNCLNALHDAVKVSKSVKGSKKAKQDVLAQQERLGILYFAWVGAANSARMSLPGAEQAAKEFLPRFRQLQAQLKIDDELLCRAIAGDCKARLAQILQGEKELVQSGAAGKKTASARADGKGSIKGGDK